MESIFSYTIQDLIDNRDGNFIHHDQYTSQLKDAEIKYCYANTIVLEVKSSHYDDPKYQGKGYGKKYKIFVLLEDFYTIAKDKDIEFSEAVYYALKYGDVHVRCDCPAFLYWGYAYISTQLRYLYGLPRENRNPNIRNPNVKGTICKHCDKAITFCIQNIKLIEAMFASYYDRIKSGDKLIAVDNTGHTVNIGTKDGNGDVFFERQVEEQEDLEAMERYQKSKKVKETEEVDDDVIENPEDWHVEDPTSGGVDWDDEE